MAAKFKPIHAFELLATIESERDITKKSALLKEYGGKSPLNFILTMNFNDNIQFALPEGMPPINPKYLDAHTHPDLMGMLSGQISKLKYCLVGSTLKKSKREEIFTDILLNCPLKDAEIVCSAKDKVLIELYPSITSEFVASVFPEYVFSIAKQEIK